MNVTMENIRSSVSFVQKLSGCEIDMVYFEGENKPPLAYVKTK